MPQPIPPVAWHGSKAAAPFDRFDPGAIQKWNKFGFWFTDDRSFAADFAAEGKGHVAACRLSVARPKVLSLAQWNAVRDAHHGDGAWFAGWRERLIANGYDGLLVEAEETELRGGLVMRDPMVVAVFDPAAIEILAWDPPRDATPESLLAKGKSNVVAFKSRRQLLGEAVAAAGTLARSPAPEGADTAWRGEPAGDWAPSLAQLRAAAAHADAHYQSGPVGDYTADDLMAELDERHDPLLGMLNDAQAAELVAYGEEREWRDLDPVDFQAWRAWVARRAPPVRPPC
jgi:hypothetical protein